MMDNKQMIDIFKALSNETRLNILSWLKHPDDNFPKQGCHLPDDTDLKGGVCVGSIQEKASISQSTISHYLDNMERAGLLIMERYGKWTYYRRNEKTLKMLSDFFGEEL